MLLVQIIHVVFFTFLSFHFNREGDLLLEVNGKRLENKRQKRVRKIFKKIKPEHSDGSIQINLVITVFTQQ